MSTTITDLSFTWQPQGPLTVGYGYGFSREAGLIGRGEKKVAQYASRNARHELTPSLLATSVKGVFRTAAAWLVEREGQILQAAAADHRAYITCDFGNAVPEKWRHAVARPPKHQDELCPVCRVFGGSGCLSGESSNLLRRQGIVRFSFDGDSDALFGTVRTSAGQIFAWEVASGDRPNPLISEQLRVARDAHLHIRIQADDEPDGRLAVALIGLSADLISSGFFRFGRFTSRGYGWVRLLGPTGQQINLADLLSGPPAGSPAGPQTAEHGAALATALLGQDARQVLAAAVREWRRD